MCNRDCCSLTGFNYWVHCKVTSVYGIGKECGMCFAFSSAVGFWKPQCGCARATPGIHQDIALPKLHSGIDGISWFNIRTLHIAVVPLLKLRVTLGATWGATAAWITVRLSRIAQRTTVKVNTFFLHVIHLLSSCHQPWAKCKKRSDRNGFRP